MNVSRPHLVFIYGPHAAGKFTTAQQVAQRTGFHFFHNQLTVTPVTALFASGPVRSELQQHLRTVLLHAAAREGLRVVFTFAYSGAVDDAFVDRIAAAFTAADGTVDFVQLHAPASTLLERVSNASRVELGKMSDPRVLTRTLTERDLYATVKHDRNLRLDTSMRSAQQNADLIIDHYNLPRAGQKPGFSHTGSVM